jgi:hypothetical protein
MTIAIACPSCGAKMKAPDGAAGLKVKCMKCATPFIAHPKGRTSAKPAEESWWLTEVPTQPVAAPQSVEGKNPYENPQPRPRDGQGVAPATGGAAAHSLGIASLVLGVLGLVLSLLPCVGVIALPLAGLGFLLGLIGGVVALVRKGHGIGFPIAGSGVNLLALMIGGFWLALSFNYADSLAKEQRGNQSAVPVGAPSVGAVPAQPPSGAMAEEWVDASRSLAQQGDVRVCVKGVQVAFVKGKEFREFTSEQKHLLIYLGIQNVGNTRKVDYTGWGAADGFLRESMPSLTDNFGNTYKRIRFGLGSRIDGQILSESIYPQKILDDLLVFETPLDNVQHLRLELPARNFEGTGKLQFQIPVAMIRR